MRTYIAVYISATLFAGLLTPIIILAARKFCLYDNCGIRKVHKSSIPRIGGIAIFLSSTALVVAVLFLNNRIGGLFNDIRVQVISLLGCGTFIFIIGLIDDICNLRARHKLAAQMLAACVMYMAGIRIESLSLTELFTIKLGFLSLPITILWIIGLTNAVNLIDGLDGLAAGISAIACGAIAIFSIAAGQVIMAVIMLAILGGLCGFLIYNFNPARIFMGDCGSMYLGFVLASSSVICTAKSGTLVGLALPILSLGLPIFDMSFAMLRRFLEGRRIMSPDRSHLHHILLDLGLRQKHVVISMYMVTAIAAGAGLLMMLSKGVNTLIIFGATVVLLILVFRFAGAMSFRNIMSGLKHKHKKMIERKIEVERYEEAELHFRQAKNFDTWWHAICFAAHKMEFAQAKLPLVNRDGSQNTLKWAKDKDNENGKDVIETTLSIPDRRSNSVLKLGINVNTNGSIESAGRRIALFGKLIERYSVTSLPYSQEVTV